MNVLYVALGWVMNHCYALCHNYGLAIVLFTIISKLILLPVGIWTHFNSIKMIKMQPDINFLKVKYYGQRDMIDEEQARLYKQENYHPLATMIPTIIQLLLLMGVVGVIRQGIQNPDINMMMGSINLGLVPAQQGVSLIFAPILAGISSLILCLAQNASNVLQSEQSKFNKYGMMVFSVGLSLYLGWFVPVGTAWYWVWSNLLAVFQMYMLNAIIKPSKYVDYERLKESREALAEIKKIGKDSKKTVSKEDKKREKADYKRFFSIVNKHLVFYSESSGFYKYFQGIIEYLLKNTNISIHYITSDPKDQIFKLAETNPQIKPYYIGENKLITLMMKMDADIVVMTMPDLENYHIKRSYIRDDIEYIHLYHGAGSGNLTMRKAATEHFDTIFCVGKHQKDEEEQLENYYRWKPRKLVEFGYPLIDQMRKDFNEKTHEVHDRKKILIAPSWQKDNIVDTCLAEMLEILKDSKYDIIVRPHPQEVRMKQSYMDTLKQKYEPMGIEIQTDFSSNNPVMDADVLITDWSGICWEYAFVTLRPVLFINTPMKIMNPEYQCIKEEPLNIALRDKIGRSLETTELNKLLETIDYLIAHADDYHVGNEKLAREYLYNLDGSAKVGAEYIIEEIQKKISNKKKK